MQVHDCTMRVCSVQILQSCNAADIIQFSHFAGMESQ